MENICRYQLKFSHSVMCLGKKKMNGIQVLSCIVTDRMIKVNSVVFSAGSTIQSTVVSQCQTDKLEYSSRKAYRLMSGLQSLMGMVVIQTEDIEPGENLEGGMRHEVEKPLYEKAMSLAIQFQVQKKKKKRINLWKLQKPIYMKSKVSFKAGR